MKVEEGLPGANQRIRVMARGLAHTEQARHAGR